MSKIDSLHQNCNLSSHLLRCVTEFCSVLMKQVEAAEVRSSKLDDVLEVDDIFHSVLLHGLALPEEVQLIFTYRKRS